MSNATRWFIAGMILFAQLFLFVIWLAPAPLLLNIIDDLHITYAQAGFILSVFPLFMGLSSFFGSKIIDRVDSANVYSLGLWLFGISSFLVNYIHSYPLLMALRMLAGIGFGITLPASGAMIMKWFLPHERPFINTVRSVLVYIAMSISYYFTVPLFNWLHTWQKALGAYGYLILFIAVIWALFGRSRSLDRNEKPSNTEEKQQVSSLRLTIAKREIMLLTIAMVGCSWTFQFFTAFLPAYFQEFRGLDIGASSAVTGILPVAGIVGGLLTGAVMGAVGLRRVFLWPYYVLILVGSIGAVYFQPGTLLYMSIALMGFSQAGRLPAMLTVPMEVEGMTPEMVGASHTLIVGLGMGASFLSPIVGGWISTGLGLNTVLYLFSAVLIVPIVCTYILPETGPRKRISSKA